MKLFVDDLRSAPAGWRLARTIQEAIGLLKTEPVEEISLDYMIGENPDENFSAVAEFIVKMPAEKRPKRAFIHTSSWEGAKILHALLQGFVEEVVRI